MPSYPWGISGGTSGRGRSPHVPQTTCRSTHEEVKRTIIAPGTARSSQVAMNKGKPTALDADAGLSRQEIIDAVGFAAPYRLDLGYLPAVSSKKDMEPSFIANIIADARCGTSEESSANTSSRPWTSLPVGLILMAKWRRRHAAVNRLDNLNPLSATSRLSYLR
eukprot:scaffold7403_cov390-Prasinococcus_capsulatus_cf.AAC.3